MGSETDGTPEADAARYARISRPRIVRAAGLLLLSIVSRF